MKHQRLPKGHPRPFRAGGNGGSKGLGEVLETFAVHKELVDDAALALDGEGHADVGGAELEVDHRLDVRKFLFFYVCKIYVCM